ncbi:MAG: serine protease [Bacteroidales bacterium]|nr:serine protease [Bacteroidales bacterium]
MPTWNEILSELGREDNKFDVIRRKYVRELSEYTGRNTIIYYSGFLQKPTLAGQGCDFSISDYDKNGFMSAVKGLDKGKGLDLILHTPGGGIGATESIVKYLHSIFGKDIRAVVPQIAMSAGTMIACACKSIVMGKQSNLGPIDPQLGSIAAHGILEEFERIKKEVSADPKQIVVWREILSKYPPTLIGECEKAIKLAEMMVSASLEDNMFENDPDGRAKARTVVERLGSHAGTLSHDRHLHIDELRDMGLRIEELENDHDLQDKVLSVHHATIISIAQTRTVKIIENDHGRAFIQSV